MFETKKSTAPKDDHLRYSQWVPKEAFVNSSPMRLCLHLVAQAIPRDHDMLWVCLSYTCGWSFFPSGYRYDPDEDSWSNEKVFPRWKERYPEPPDLLGVTRVYEPAIDRPVIRASQA